VCKTIQRELRQGHVDGRENAQTVRNPLLESRALERTEERFSPQTSCPRRNPGTLARQQHLDSTWAQIQHSLRTSFSESTYQVWLAALEPIPVEGTVLYVKVPDGNAVWVGRRFKPAIASAAAEADPSIRSVELVEAHEASALRQRLASTPEVAGSTSSPALFKPAYTFDRFVIGKTNHFAHAAALAAAEMPAHAYNPLLIHGPSGVGKTHLLQAIGNYITTHDTHLSVHYTTVEGFTSDFTWALKQNKVDDFKRRYRRCDALLLDDLQFLEGKPKTAEEFFHTFDSLLTTGAQIVITSDRDPLQVAFLEPRFKERLQAGLTINLSPPNQSTRLAILRKLIALNDVEIPPDVVTHLAERVTSNVRALEGALIRIVAFASLRESTITSDLVDQVLASLYSIPPAAPVTPKPSPAQIQAETAIALGLEPPELCSARRSRPVVYARQIAMYLCRELSALSYPEIARHFDRRDHTTALHAYRKIKAQILSDQATQNLVTTITDALHSSQHSSTHNRHTGSKAPLPSTRRIIHRSPAPNHYN
jgi:chromosomal replication initiator protein